MKIATFNVNSIKARLPRVLEWLEDFQPDVALLQELKCEEENFPRMEIEDLGYHAEVHGQKSYNGVAILSKSPIADVVRGLPDETGPGENGHDDGDAQARYIEATVKDDNGEDIRVASIYLPNGNPVEDKKKFHYKLHWMERLAAHVENDLLPSEKPVVLGGDYNVCPTDGDVYDPEGWADDALCRPESRNRFRRLLNLGMVEAWRALHPNSQHQYSYWDYVKGRFQKDEGLRIDHLLLSPQAADRLQECEIDKKPRDPAKMEAKPSDHTPVWCRID